MPTDNLLDEYLDIARTPGAGPQLLQLAADHPSPVVRAEVASNTSCPGPLLTALVADPDPAVRAAAAANTTLPDAAASLLATDPEPVVRAAVAAQVTASLVEQLTVDPDPAVRAAAAGNRHVSVETVRDLAENDPDDTVRHAARTAAEQRHIHVTANPAANTSAAGPVTLPVSGPLDADAADKMARLTDPATIVDVLELTRDPSEVVRAAAISRTDVPLARVEQVAAGDPSPLVRTHAIDTLGRRDPASSLWPTLAGDPDPAVRAAVAAQVQLPAATWDTLSTDADPAVRATVAGNTHTPDAQSRTLADDRDPKVRSTLANRPGLPTVAVLTLAEDRVPSIRAAVARNQPQVPSRFDTMGVPDLVRWGVTGHWDRVRELSGDADGTLTRQLGDGFPGTVRELADFVAGCL